MSFRWILFQATIVFLVAYFLQNAFKDAEGILYQISVFGAWLATWLVCKLLDVWRAYRPRSKLRHGTDFGPTCYEKRPDRDKSS